MRRYLVITIIGWRIRVTIETTDQPRPMIEHI
jgi:hypothetical protein